MYKPLKGGYNEPLISIAFPFIFALFLTNFEKRGNIMKKNRFVIECHTYAPELNTVRYYRTMQKLPGQWQALNTCKDYAECVRFIRAQMKKGTRRPNMHYSVVTFSDNGNVYAAGWFKSYTE